ncbi:TonB-dependent siderophore receptor [Hydrogenophaga sp.]|uniref:TonB-dependent receptor n=1 Tax=Hydrogenophaga sp. TaxID=1904254 RepID=UPI002633ED72|nr:TonB-dependent siderophore receptor [Hydrogenophaga sp.]MCW5652664.1 TonB-dependent siderophore receptor [Hydrogenophaga sp.]
MSQRKHRQRPARTSSPLQPASQATLLPLGAMLLAGSVGAMAQTAPTTATVTLPTVEVTESAEVPQTKNELRTTNTRIGKGTQALRDIPQSVTVMTERLLDDRNLDDFREVLRTTAGVTFQAGETGEEDVRLRGFSLQQSGDIYTDGIRDGALYERDTFNNDRVEVLKGSASMLFGKGSTGGVVNQVSKQPYLLDQHEVDYTFGTGKEHRLTGDFNFMLSEDSAFRLNAMVHTADNYGAKLNKRGIAPTYRWGIGTRNEFSIGFYHLESESKPTYNHPWFLSNGVIVPTLPARNYYGLASDHLDTSADYATFSHTYRFDRQSSLTTRVRHGRYERDLWASVIGFRPAAEQPGGVAASINTLGPNTVLGRTAKGRVGISDTTQIQSDYVNSFEALGKKHDLIAGVDIYQEDAKRANNFPGGNSGLTTLVGTPNDGDSRADTRGAPPFNTFDARNLGLYIQDTVSLTSEFKLIGGLRHDNFKASYVTNAGVANSVSASLWSPRVGALFQPDENTSYYISYGTSFNTSGDTYQFTPGAPNTKDANTPPEKSRNLEIGSKFELFEKRASLGAAFFYSEKYNERNTDPDTASTQQLLSGKRHAAGMEFNLAGRITPKWEIFYNHTWIPNAKIDKSNVALNNAGTGAQVQGDRPGLTPKHSASLWTTYLVTPKLRIGGGLNYRGKQNPEGARHVTADSFTTVDAMAEYTLTDSTVIKLNVTNLTNELYADSLYRGFYVPGAARSIQVSLKKMF